MRQQLGRNGPIVVQEARAAFGDHDGVDDHQRQVQFLDRRGNRFDDGCGEHASRYADEVVGDCSICAVTRSADSGCI
jgi:hypothetical protein